MSTHKRIALLAAVVFAAAMCARAQLAAAEASPTPGISKASAPAATPDTPKPSKAKAADKPAESKPAESKTAEAKPSGAKAAGTKAAVKGIPALPPEKAQAVAIPRVEKPPVIDGKLDDEVWKSAAVLKDFYQINPGDNTAPTKPTEVMVAYDAKTLYFAFHCYDDPDKVRATVAKRDSVLDTEDSIRVLLDTFNDQRKAYVLVFNPLGIQQDGVRTEGNGVDWSVDIVMESKGALTKDGYTVEAAIPFKSLRYEAGKGKQWGLQVFRIIQRLNGEQDSWMPISRDVSGLLPQEGHITGLDNIAAERSVELIPSFTASETGKRVRTMSSALAGSLGLADQGKFVNQPVKFDPGLTAKFVMSSAAIFDLAVNPDFAQVEADATVSTANQRFPIFFEEKRPFFLEGKDIFNTLIAAVHTRTIIDPDYAFKFTGKRGRNSYGVLFASDNAPGDFTNEQRFDPEQLPAAGSRVIGRNATVGILRLKRDVGKENFIGLLAMAYNFVGRSNYVGGFDSRVKFNKQTTLDFQVLGTNSHVCALAAKKADDTCQTLNGFAYAYNLTQSKRHLGWNINGVARTAGYRAFVGFTRRVNTDSHNFNIWYNTEPKPKARVVSWEFDSYLGGNHDFQGRLQNWTYEGQMGPNLQRQTFIRWGYNTGYERDFASEFGLALFANGRSETSAHSKNVFGYAGSNPTKRINFFYFLGYRWGEMDYDFGAGPRFPRASLAAIADPDAPLQPGPGDLLYTNGNVTYKASTDLNLALSFSKNRLRRHDSGRIAFDENIASLKATYQFTRFVFARARVDFDSIASNLRGQFLFGWTPNPGTSFYVGYNDDVNRRGFNPFSGQLEPGLRRNGRTFFIKASYLFRRSF